MTDFITNLYTSLGVSSDYADIFTKLSLLAGAILLSLLSDLIAKKLVVDMLTAITRKTSSKWDDIVVEKGVFKGLAHYAPALVLYFTLAQIFPDSGEAIGFVQRIILLYMIALSILVVNKVLDSTTAIYQTYEVSKSRPIKGYIQILSIFVYILGFILMITTLLNKSPLGILSGIGALSAVIMLVFKDSILGLVSSIQLSANKLIRIGDWIEVPQYGADGDVVDINLQSVMVQNWDKTMVTFPIYALTNSSFKNWRGMSESGGRRIKRSIILDMNSIRFLNDRELDRLENIGLIREYLKNKRSDINGNNEALTSDSPLNRRQLTNAGTFRAYIVAYLKANPNIHDSMTFLVRQLAPGPQGLPLEIYVFSNKLDWSKYEDIQADIFDHLLATLPEFDLSVYQNPGSYDLSRLAPVNAQSRRQQT